MVVVVNTVAEVDVNVVDGSVIVMRNELVYVVVRIWPEVGFVAALEPEPEASGAEADWDLDSGSPSGAVGTGVDCEALAVPDESIGLRLFVTAVVQLVDVTLGKSLKPPPIIVPKKFVSSRRGCNPDVFVVVVGIRLAQALIFKT